LLSMALSVGALVGLLTVAFHYTADNDPTSVDYTYYQWHQACMGIAVLGFFMFGTQIFTAISGVGGDTLRNIHSFFMTMAMALLIAGLALVYRYHNNQSPIIDDMYSVHAWMGMLFFVLFGLNYLSGLLAFVFKILPAQSIRPIHKASGPLMILLAVVAVCTGLMDRQRILGFYIADVFDPAFRATNATAVLVVLAGMFALHTFTSKRKADSTDNTTPLLNG